MKKILIVLLVFMMLFGLVACGESENGNTTESGKPAEEKQEVSIGDTFESGPYEITVTGTRKAKDYEGNPAIILIYSWTNNSEETTSWMGSMMSSVFQDGVQLEVAIMDSGIDVDQIMKEVRPGTKLEGIEEGFATTSENELEIEIQAIEEAFTEDLILIKTGYPKE